MMKHVYMAPDIEKYICKLGEMNEEEIYGWLIGYQDNGTAYIITALECQNYIEQSYINAIPDPTELQKIGNLMPHGIGIIGIFHSHPTGSDIFHSHIDDETLLSLSRQLPNCISIITNGEEAKYYKMDDDDNLTEIDKHLERPSLPNFFIIDFNNKFKVSIEDSLSDAKNLNILLLNNFKEFLEENWDNFRISDKKGNKISENSELKKYIENTRKKGTLLVKYEGKNLKKNKNALIQLFITQDENKEDFNNEDFFKMEFDLKSKNLFYILDNKKQLKDLKESIKNEVINYSLIPKIYNVILRLNNQKAIFPRGYFFNFFGFYIKKLFFPKKINKNLNYKQNKVYQNLSKENFEFFRRIFKLLKIFSLIEINEVTKNSLKELIKDLKAFMKNHPWDKKYSSQIKQLGKSL